MSASDSDTYDYEMYGIEFYEELEGPPLIKTKHRLLAAVVQNEVGVLQDLLVSPKQYNVTDKWGFNLLQIAVLRDNVEVFDYLMSLPDYPLEFENEGKTALEFSLSGFVSNDIWMQEHFSYELVKRGACIDKVLFEGNTPLHCALERSYCKTAELLIEKGVDLNTTNDEGNSPLDMALFDSVELIPMLLMLGAEPSTSHFEVLVFMRSSQIVRETLFWYLFDEFSRPELRLDVILKLAETHSRLFYDLIELAVRPNVDTVNALEVFTSLCKIATKELQVVMEKFGGYLKEIFSNLSCCEPVWLGVVVPLSNLDLIRESLAGASFISFVSNLVSTKICNYLCMMESPEQFLTEQFCFLLSCNMKVTDYDLALIYKHYGYCELFKILLHMEIEPCDRNTQLSFMPVLIFDINTSLRTFLEDPLKYSEESVDELVRHFAHQDLKKLHCERAEQNLVQKRDDLPEIPLLLELARDVFRKQFVKTFKMKTSRQFYTYLNCLPISDFHKKIVSYEVRLY